MKPDSFRFESKEFIKSWVTDINSMGLYEGCNTRGLLVMVFIDFFSVLISPSPLGGIPHYNPVYTQLNH